MLLDKLSSKDIANLRLVSRAFRQLPKLLFMKLLREDMPWLWEVEDYDAGNTNWFSLYQMVKGCWLNIKGLKNRQRIWKDVEEVVRRIKVCRENGQIVDEIPDAYLVAQQSNDSAGSQQDDSDEHEEDYNEGNGDEHMDDAEEEGDD